MLYSQLGLSRFLLGVTLFVAAVSSAHAMEVRAKAQVPYKVGFFSKEPDPRERDQAIKEAKLNAWSRYTSTFNPAKMQSYKAIEEDVLANIDDYVIDYSVLDESYDSQRGRMSVSIRASINEAAINTRLNASNSGTGNLGGGELFSFVFVSRQASTHKTFNVRQTDIRMEESALSATQHGGMSGSSASINEANTSMTKTTTGGSTQRKANQITYRTQSSSDIDAALSETFSGYGFDVVGYQDILANCGGASIEAIKSEFTETDEMAVSTRKAAINAARDCDVKYFATGTLDVGMQDTDPVTGNQRVYVSVRSQVWSIDSRLPRKVASVGPVQYAGLGPDAEVATRNALRLSAEESAKTIVDQLNSRGLR